MNVIETAEFKQWDGPQADAKRKIEERVAHCAAKNAHIQLQHAKTWGIGDVTLHFLPIGRHSEQQLVFGLHGENVILLGGITADPHTTNPMKGANAGRLIKMAEALEGQQRILPKEGIQASSHAAVDPAEAARKQKAADLLAKFGAKGNGGNGRGNGGRH